MSKTAITSEQAQSRIDAIDLRIDVVRRALIRRLGHFNTLSAAAFHKAWLANPALRRVERSLFQMRGDAMDLRDAALEREYRREQRAERAAIRRIEHRNCPECGQPVFA